MNTFILTTFVAAGILAGPASFAAAPEKVKFNDLPAAVQKTVNSQIGGAGIASIERHSRNGIPLYEVRASQPRNSKPIYISETGSIVKLDDVIAKPSQAGTRKATFRELPVPVQNTVRGQAGAARVEDIDVVTKDGETTYNVAFKQDGKNVELWLDSNGNILNQGQPAVAGATQTRVPLAAATKVKATELPARVRNTLTTYARGAEIEDVDRGTLQGRTVYEAAFKRNGENIELRVGEDGTVVRDDVNDRFLTSIGQPPVGSAQASSSTRTPSWAAAEARLPLGAASKVTLREVPSAVRETLRTYAGDATIEDIDKGTLGRTTVYQASFKSDGQNVELRVAEDGSLVKDRVNERFITQQLRRPGSKTASGKPASWEVLTGGGSSAGAELANAKGVRFQQTPAAVQDTLRSEAGQAAIDSVRQGTLNGQTVYEGSFKRDGKNTVVRVAPDGSLVK